VASGHQVPTEIEQIADDSMSTQETLRMTN
jgi:hypothetical protein